GEAAPVKERLAILPNVDAVDDMKPDGGRQRIHVTLRGEDEEVSGLLAELVSGGVPVLHFTEETRDLESVFMRATRGIVS
ncbi:MAG: hypothetical protein ACFB51_08560, partial [Anaerolineae bacterium]